jgi:hypothetical protein
MELYNKSEELVKLLEQRVQEEQNDSFKSQYQTLLQQQRNASSSLKSLAEARGSKEQAQQNNSTANFENEFASESDVSSANLTQRQKNATMNQRKETSQDDSSKDSNK